MIVTLEAYKDNSYILDVLSNIYNDMQNSYDKNPYNDFKITDWNIIELPNIKKNIEVNLIFRNDNTKEDINIIFELSDNLRDDNRKFNIGSVMYYKNNGTDEENIELNSYIYNVCNSILELIEKKQK